MRTRSALNSDRKFARQGLLKALTTVADFLISVNMPLIRRAILHLAVGCTIAANSGISAESTNGFPAVTMKLAYPELTVQRPVWLCEAPDQSGRIFLVEQGGKILILPKDRNGKEASVFLDITDRKPYT